MNRKFLLLFGASALLFTGLWYAWLATLQLVFGLVFGWCPYLGRIVSQVVVAWDGVLTVLVCVAVFAGGLHRFLCWLCCELQRRSGSPAKVVRAWSFRRTCAIVVTVFVMFIAGISATGVAHQVAWILGDKHPRIVAQPNFQSGNSYFNLYSMGSALHAKVLPFTRKDPRGRQLHSWQTVLLPYVWTDSILGGQIDETLPWDDSRNSGYFRGIVRCFLHPGIAPMRDARGYGLSHYAGNVHVVGRDKELKVSETSNGISNLIVAGEAAAGFKAWGDPSNLRDPARGLTSAGDSFGDTFGIGANVLMADGSVRFISRRTSPSVLREVSIPLRTRK